jgi:uncharacterized protein
MDWQYIVAILLVLIGVIGTALPILPGVPLVFSGLLLAAWHDNFAHVSFTSMVIIGVIAVLAWLVDFVASIITAKKAGASNQALWGAAIGGLLGILGGIPGLIIGPALGAIIGELIAHRNTAKATVVGVAAGLGFVLALVLKLVLVLIMLAVFGYAYYQ